MSWVKSISRDLSLRLGGVFLIVTGHLLMNCYVVARTVGVERIHMREGTFIYVYIYIHIYMINVCVSQVSATHLKTRVP